LIKGRGSRGGSRTGERAGKAGRARKGPKGSEGVRKVSKGPGRVRKGLRRARKGREESEKGPKGGMRPEMNRRSRGQPEGPEKFLAVKCKYSHLPAGLPVDSGRRSRTLSGGAGQPS
jgi:hypothetical protein